MLVNCEVATLGSDYPAVSCLILARPTQSLVLHLQILGRGLRTHPGKQDCLILDHAGNTQRLGFADQEHEWSLEQGVTAAPRKTTKSGEKVIDQMECGECKAVFSPAPTCPSCGHGFKTMGSGVQWIDGRLVELSNVARLPSLEDRKQFYRECLGWCRDHGKPAGIAFHRYKDRFGVKPPYDWQNLEPLPPSQETQNHIKRGFIAWRAQQKKTKALKEAS